MTNTNTKLDEELTPFRKFLKGVLDLANSLDADPYDYVFSEMKALKAQVAELEERLEKAPQDQ